MTMKTAQKLSIERISRVSVRVPSLDHSNKENFQLVVAPVGLVVMY